MASAADQRAWRKKNKAKVREHNQRNYERHRDAHIAASRRYHLKTKFGLSLDDFDQKLREQGGLCAVCRQPETTIRRGERKSLDVDHNHTTGKVRGLLCSACNTALGLLREDPLRIRALAVYIEHYEAN